MRCLLLSAYHAQSHAYWCDGLTAAFPDWHWQLVSLPARYFNWRIRGNALYLAHRYAALFNEPWDLIIATSMTDLAGLRSFCPALAQVPTLLYFHENQFAYPVNEVQAQRLEPQMMTLFSAQSADLLAFNSDYNRQTFLQGVAELMAKLPDAVPPHLVASLAAKSTVLPVPLRDTAYLSPQPKSTRPTIIWNHRWEHDKAPERLLGGLVALGDRLPELQVHVVGQQFRQVPPAFAQLHRLLVSRGSLGAWGYQQARGDYDALLASSHCVVSTALHDFQGLSVLEAVAAGAQAVLPLRLAYPEWFRPQDCGVHFYSSDLQNPAAEAAQLAEAIVAACSAEAVQSASVQQLSWSSLRPAYRQTLTALAG